MSENIFEYECWKCDWRGIRDELEIDYYYSSKTDDEEIALMCPICHTDLNEEDEDDE